MNVQLLNFLRPVIIFLGGILFALSAFIIFHFNQDYQLNTSLEAFLKKDFVTSKQNLELVKNNLSKGQYFLSLYYITKEMGKKQLSQQFLQKAYDHCESSEKKLLQEIIFNQALIAYQDNRSSDLSQHLKHLQGGFSIELSNLMEGLQEFSVGSYAQAIKKWEGLEGHFTPPSPWMKWQIEQYFPSHFLSLKRIEAHIHLGKFMEARKDLEVFIQASSSEPFNQYRAFSLMGDSYFKEALSKPLDLAGPYFELAKSYYENLPIHSSEYLPLKTRILKDLKEHISTHLPQRSASIKPLYPLFSFLQSWKAKAVFQDLGFQFLSLAQTSLNQKGIEELKEALDHYPLLMNGLKRHLLSEIAKSILENQLTTLQQSWKLAEDFSLVDEDLESKVVPLLEDNLVSNFQSSHPDFNSIYTLITFYRQHISSAQHRLQLAKSLLKVSEEKWTGYQEGKQTLKVMIAIDEMLQQGLKTFIKEDIKHLLQKVYQHALNEENKDKLHLVHHAMKYFNFKLSELSVVSNT